MEKRYYLPIGHKIGGHYEIVKVLGEDEFEILYLVKDLHLRGREFVLKELYLKAYSSRDKFNVYTMAKSKAFFEETKEEVIAEVALLQKKTSSSVAQVYGYFEENNTVYTITEFRKEEAVENYLHLNPTKERDAKTKETIKEDLKTLEDKPPVPDEKEKPKEKSTIFLKILIVVSLLLLALAYYSYNMIQEDKERIKNRSKLSVVVKEPVVHHPPLEDKQERNKRAITKEEAPKQETSTKETDTKEMETKKIKSIDDLIDVSDDEFDEELNNTLDEESSLELPNKDVFTRTAVENFLNHFMALSTSGTIDDIVSNYDSKVEQYFSLKNITPREVRRDKIRYQKRWTRRDFVLANFKILNIYEKEGFTYCDVQTTTYWNVATDRMKTASGTSRGFMTLKNTANGFKVASIYTLQ